MIPQERVAFVVERMRSAAAEIGATSEELIAASASIAVVEYAKTDLDTKPLAPVIPFRRRHLMLVTS